MTAANGALAKAMSLPATAAQKRHMSKAMKDILAAMAKLGMGQMGGGIDMVDIPTAIASGGDVINTSHSPTDGNRLISLQSAGNTPNPFSAGSDVSYISTSGMGESDKGKLFHAMGGARRRRAKRA
jgi:hypothetical protein